MPESTVAAARRTSPGLMPSVLRPVEVDLELEGRLLDRQLDPRCLDPVDAGDQLAHLVGLGAKDVELVPEHADGQVRSFDAVGVAEDVVDALLGIGRAPTFRTPG